MPISEDTKRALAARLDVMPEPYIPKDSECWYFRTLIARLEMASKTDDGWIVGSGTFIEVDGNDVGDMRWASFTGGTELEIVRPIYRSVTVIGKPNEVAEKLGLL